MKIFGILDNYLSKSELSTDFVDYILLPDTSVLKSGKPFFIPDLETDFKVMTSIVIKINRLGKGIAPRYAPGYYSQYALCSLFYSPAFLKELKSKGKSIVPALAYDYNLPMSEFYDKQNLNNPDYCYEISISPEQTFSWKLNNVACKIDNIISRLSINNTLKTGDLIILALAETDVSLQTDYKFSMNENGKQIYWSNLK